MMSITEDLFFAIFPGVSVKQTHFSNFRTSQFLTTTSFWWDNLTEILNPYLREVPFETLWLLSGAEISPYNCGTSSFNHV